MTQSASRPTANLAPATPGQYVPGIVGFEHCPVPASQIPALWQGSLGCAHITGLIPVHNPSRQKSVRVQPLPSLQKVPSVLTGFEHFPVPGSQVPMSWHWSLAVHTTGLLPAHAPAWQVSVCVHAFPSLHRLPSGFAGLEHCPVPGSQVPMS
jgi:hypothetical protein